jgi:hypothetical protein
VQAGKRKMSNARVLFELNAHGQAVLVVGGRREGPTGQHDVEGGSPRQVLDPDRNLRTMVVIIHEEVVNQFPGMAYLGGVFSGREVSMRALDYIPEYPYPVRATVDVAGYWRLRGFSRFSVVHLILSCNSQCVWTIMLKV